MSGTNFTSFSTTNLSEFSNRRAQQKAKLAKRDENAMQPSTLSSFFSSSFSWSSSMAASSRMVWSSVSTTELWIQTWKGKLLPCFQNLISSNCAVLQIHTKEVKRINPRKIEKIKSITDEFDKTYNSTISQITTNKLSDLESHRKVPGNVHINQAKFECN